MLQEKNEERIEHYYDANKPRCPQKCIVGACKTYGIGGDICVCELVAGHAGAHERVPTMRTATAGDTRNFPVFADFVSSKAINETRPASAWSARECR